ncbi:uncharacterized protein L969DRAFT_45447 [Mixia osmundae IAM 14324]|uniref:Distal membrane-arm assembly complex protein 1-like domain-containing protein n=1 Tax=Mixia osmundae (strain CBS 9802 / IAM 14324 / JCM 22182 / KY 12970) TaxID=764103 RepID=G7DY78_MIXOS|nr:uncharacterized protein L969DRAFT_45447 [Mixia osmundae IAM 14324]KEI41441.1 hypothetical protein L969DRAFT_45447 [Mixia osmundae IAM 14324]GAA95538.1 hypothetical protein E5Q_02193 [Mixia osmundae IAM 14324]
MPDLSAPQQSPDDPTQPTAITKEERINDCVACRVMGSLVLGGAGVYALAESRRFAQIGRGGSIAARLVGYGLIAGAAYRATVRSSFGAA